MPANSANGMHHHKGCRGKAHGSGIAKQSNGNNVVATTKESTRNNCSHRKDSRVSLNGRSDSDSSSRKISRNSVSSWECSDSDSLNSSEHGLDSAQDPASKMIRRIDRVLNGIDEIKRNQQAAGRHPKKKAVRRRMSGEEEDEEEVAKRFPKRESWADSLRGGLADDRYKKMEDGWNDSSVIRIPRERKWQRITADIEQRACAMNGRNGEALVNAMRRNSLNLSRKNGLFSRKISKRTRVAPARVLYDVVEWEELLELAQARKLTRGKPAGYLKNLEVLLENKAPQTVKVFNCDTRGF